MEFEEHKREKRKARLIKEEHTFKMPPAEFYTCLRVSCPDDLEIYDRYLDQNLFLVDEQLRSIYEEFLSWEIRDIEFEERLNLSMSVLMAGRRRIKEHYTEEFVKAYRMWRSEWEPVFTNTNESKDDATNESS